MNEIESRFDVSVYPNPSSGDFILTFQNSSDAKINILIVDVMGRLIHPAITLITNAEFRISNISSGIYAAIVSNGKDKRTIKLVKTE